MEAPGIDLGCTKALRSAPEAMTKRWEGNALRSPNRVEAPGIAPEWTEPKAQSTKDR